MVRNLTKLGDFIRKTNHRVLGRRFVQRLSVRADEEEVPPGVTKYKNNSTKNIEECEWIPHPRSGIYFPKGHDWVMEDVPATSGSGAPAYWLRNVDGVDVNPHGEIKC